ncbi:WD40-repeat-containing domain protein [Penicillium angulare]|uniref:WD40-repeat-containing domain protein n=1 Tax=Penicillium angulare TaxID=116970 RepID=UPI002541E0DF|nr:WD40-repeat-containing domain protein [Penicillium angulare]KAJ5289111.1 WD40-repeat-containing domain protein [Penicillium angulare]
MEVIGSIANAVAIVQIAGAVAKVVGGYIIEVHNARDDILALHYAVTDLQSIVQDLQKFLQDGKNALQTSSRLADSIKKCLCDLQDLEKKLGAGKGKSLMRKFGLRSLKWPLKRLEVEGLIQRLEGYKTSFVLSLQVDQTSLILDNAQNTDLSKLEVAAEAEYGSFSDREEEECLQGTRTELLKDIMEWTMLPCRKQKIIFLLSGMAGTGKSTVSRTIAKALKDNNRLGASFFFKRGEKDRGNAKKLFPTLIKQLVLQIPGLGPGVQKAIRKDPEIGSKSLGDQFDKLILQPLLEFDKTCQSSQLVVVVVDALDECDHNNDIRTIVRLFSLLQDAHKVCVKVFMTSRPELPTRLGFSDLGDHIYQDIALHEISEEVTEHDIRLFLIDQFAKIRADRNVAMEWPDYEVIQSMVSISIPLFISAATMCRYIENSKREPMRRLKELLQDQTHYVTKMDKTYLPILRQLVDDQDDEDKQELLQEFYGIIGTIILLDTPFSVNTLSRFLNIEPDVIINHLDSFQSVLNVPKDPDLPVRTLHLSFRDFLVQSKSEFRVNEPEKHREIALRCLQVMRNHLKRNMCDLEAGTERTDIDSQFLHQIFPPELNYACQHWVYHLEQSEIMTADSVMDLILSFLQDHFLHWMEAMSLQGLAPDMIEMVNLLQLIFKDTAYSTLSHFLQDAKRFIFKNSQIADRAPLQIYYSGLIFAPRNSIVRKQFDADLPDWKYRLPESEGWGAELQTLEAPQNPATGVGSVEFSPDGRLLASGWDYAVRVWDASTGKLRQTFECPSETFLSVAFSPDGRLLASGSIEHKVRLWDVLTGTLEKILEDHVEDQSVESYSSAVAFSPDNELLASGADNTVRVWNISTGELFLLEGHSNEVSSVAFSPNSRFLASGSRDKTVRLWDLSTGMTEYVQILDHGETEVTSISFSPDSQLLASSSGDTIYIWDVSKNPTVLQRVLKGHILDVGYVAFSPCGQLLASASSDLKIRIWDVSTGTLRQMLESKTHSSTYLAFSPSGRLLASCCSDAAIRLWDLSIDTVPLERHSHYLVESVWSIAISPSTQLIATGSYGHKVSLWDLPTNKLQQTLEGHSDDVISVAFSADGQLLASGSVDYTVRVWDLSTGTGLLRHVIEPNVYCIDSLAFSPDGRLLACDCGDVAIRLYNTATGILQQIIELEEAFVSESDEGMDLEFSRDGSCLITTYGVLDIQSGTEKSVSKSSCTSREVSTEQTQWITGTVAPPELRFSTIAANGKLVALGHSSGLVSFIDFNP